MNTTVVTSAACDLATAPAGPHKVFLTAASPKRPRALYHPRRCSGLIKQPQRVSSRRWLRWAALLLLAGYLLFAHFGCHGDEDNELFALLRACRPSASSQER